MKRCANGTRRNKKTGKCEKKLNYFLQAKKRTSRKVFKSKSKTKMEVIVVPSSEQKNETFNYIMGHDSSGQPTYVGYDQDRPTGWFRVEGVQKDFAKNNVNVLRYTIKNMFSHVKGTSKMSKAELVKFLNEHIEFEQ